MHLAQQAQLQPAPPHGGWKGGREAGVRADWLAPTSSGEGVRDPAAQACLGLCVSPPPPVLPFVSALTTLLYRLIICLHLS